MKKLYTLISAVLISASLWAQAPQKMSYQAVIRGVNNALVVEKQVGVKISILQGSESGTSVYTETHTPTTNANGLATLSIGAGTIVTGEFSKIDWSKGPYFVKTETDVEGGTNYQLTAVSELMSVPFALYAANSQPGPKGEKGDTGAVGPQGTAGKDGVDGKDGAIGPKGDKGEQGIQGPAGKDGNNGVDGKEGLQGPMGPKGDTGAVGPQGIPGKDGLQGPIGPKGDKGETGAQGPAGKDGMDGIQGVAGEKGEKGDQGIAGKDGVDGKDGKVEFQNFKVSTIGDTLYVTNGNFVIIPGISAAQPKPTSGYGPTISDVDGNTYKTVYIGTQQWMAENLKTEKYNDGTFIPNITNNITWDTLRSGAWCNYNNSDSLGNIYGKLYNWYAICPTTNGNREICPTGWHVPIAAEWDVLLNYLGGWPVAGGKMKEIGTSHFIIPNYGATNESLFTGLPGGTRFWNGSDFRYIGEWGFWWTSTGKTNDGDFSREQKLVSGSVKSEIDAGHKWAGMSIRCLKD
jgi:uncharacterized protein (TIGR02145 family)